jgi:hypothetical protein
MRIWWLGSPRERSGASPTCLRRTRIEPTSCARPLNASLSGAKLPGAKPRAQGIFGNEKILTERRLGQRLVRAVAAIAWMPGASSWAFVRILRRVISRPLAMRQRRETAERTGSLRTQSGRHRVDHGTICGRSCANSEHYKPICACVDRTFVNPKFVASASRIFSRRDSCSGSLTNSAACSSNCSTCSP